MRFGLEKVLQVEMSFSNIKYKDHKNVQNWSYNSSPSLPISCGGYLWRGRGNLSLVAVFGPRSEYSASTIRHGSEIRIYMSHFYHLGINGIWDIFLSNNGTNSRDSNFPINTEWFQHSIQRTHQRMKDTNISDKAVDCYVIKLEAYME